jgi:hypothetical protein
MHLNITLISHTKLVCENVVFSEPWCLEIMCEVRKAFIYFKNKRVIFGYLK